MVGKNKITVCKAEMLRYINASFVDMFSEREPKATNVVMNADGTFDIDLEGGEDPDAH